jgi:cytochrome c5
LRAKILRSQLPAELEVWHEGRCGHCNRKLTVTRKLSELAFGPDCSEKLGIVRVQCEVVADPILPPPVAEQKAEWNDRLQVVLDETAAKATEGLSPDPKTGMFLPSPAWLAQQARVKAKIAAMRRR